MPLASNALVAALAAYALAVHARAQLTPAVPTYVTLADPDWPDADAWAALNSSVSGKLSALRPWAAVCYAEDPLFDQAACQSVLQDYSNNLDREEYAAPLLWENWQSCGSDQGCNLDNSNPQIVSNATCGQGSTPPYSVRVASSDDVSTVVNWAVQNKVKLTVKNTGHDYLGRAAAPSTLQVWTHFLTGISFSDAFVPQGSSAKPVSAITVQAGVQSEQLYAFAGDNNVTVPLGGCLSVGSAGGYVQGGGHGPMAPALGLAADAALEFEIVTADGLVRTINDAQDPDLFWAVRGGGAGTFGIITSMTLATFPATPYAYSLLTVVPNSGLNVSEQAVDFLSLMGRHANDWIESGISLVGFVSTTAYIAHLYWPASTSLDVLYPFYDEVAALSGTYTVAANQTSETPFSSVSSAMLEQIGPFFDMISAYGSQNRFASRLVPHTMFDDAQSIDAVSRAMWAGHDLLNQPLQSGPAAALSESPVAILGDMPYATRSAVNETGANPALYAATWHVMYSVAWPTHFDAETTAAIEAGIHAATGPLTDIGVTGSYQNEGDAYEEDWQQAFFGYKYDQLLDIKQKYDPANFFNSWRGVGFVEDLDAWQCYRSASPAQATAPSSAARRAGKPGPHDEL